MKLLSTTLALTMLTGIATAQNFENDGKIGNLDFAMQGELENYAGQLSTRSNAIASELHNMSLIVEKNAEAVGATGVAMSMLPSEKGKVLMGVGAYGNEKALSIGYNLEKVNLGMSYDSRNTFSVGAGFAF